MSFLDNFDRVLGTLSETYSEVVTADNSGASPAAYTQTSAAVDATQQPISTTPTISEWLINNWLLLVVVLAGLLVLLRFL